MATGNVGLRFKRNGAISQRSKFVKLLSERIERKVYKKNRFFQVSGISSTIISDIHQSNPQIFSVQFLTSLNFLNLISRPICKNEALKHPQSRPWPLDCHRNSFTRYGGEVVQRSQARQVPQRRTHGLQNRRLIPLRWQNSILGRRSHRHRQFRSGEHDIFEICNLGLEQNHGNCHR